MSNAVITPVHARPGSVMLIRDGECIPLELTFEGVDHRNFGLWRIGTKLRRTDQLSVTGIGYNFVRGDYE